MKKSNVQNNTQAHINSLELIKNNPLVKRFKRKAKLLYKEGLKVAQQDNDFSLSFYQNIVVKEAGYKNWHEFIENIKSLYKTNNYNKVITYCLPSALQNTTKNKLNIGYDKNIGLFTLINKDNFPKSILIDGQSDFRNKIESHLIRQIIDSGQHLLYIDGQNNTKHTDDIIATAKLAGRESDIRILSFLSSDISDVNKNQYKWSLPRNIPFDSYCLTQWLYYTCDIEENGSMLRGRLLSLLSGLLMALVNMRDKSEIILDFNKIKDSLLLENIIELSQCKDFPEKIIAAIKSYLYSIPGFKEAVKNQDKVVNDYHLGVTKIINKALNVLTQTYAHLVSDVINLDESLRVLNEIDGEDNNLIFIVQLPNIKMLPDELKIFNNYVLALFKSLIYFRLNDINRVINPLINKWVFINNCQLLDSFAVVPVQLRALKMDLVISCDVLEQKNNNIDVDAFNSMIANMNIQYQENNAQLGDYQVEIEGVTKNLSL